MKNPSMPSSRLPEAELQQQTALVPWSEIIATGLQFFFLELFCCLSRDFISQWSHLDETILERRIKVQFHGSTLRQSHLYEWEPSLSDCSGVSKGVLGLQLRSLHLCLLSVQSRPEWSSTSNFWKLGSDQDHLLWREHGQPVSLTGHCWPHSPGCRKKRMSNQKAHLLLSPDRYFLSTEGSPRRRQLYRFFFSFSSENGIKIWNVHFY